MEQYKLKSLSFQDLENFSSEAFIDVFLHMDTGEHICAHKLILGMRSKYFYKFFETIEKVSPIKSSASHILMFNTLPEVLHKAVDILYGRTVTITEDYINRGRLKFLLSKLGVEFTIERKESPGPTCLSGGFQSKDVEDVSTVDSEKVRNVEDILEQNIVLSNANEQIHKHEREDIEKNESKEVFQRTPDSSVVNIEFIVTENEKEGMETPVSFHSTQSDKSSFNPFGLSSSGNANEDLGVISHMLTIGKKSEKYKCLICDNFSINFILAKKHFFSTHKSFDALKKNIFSAEKDRIRILNMWKEAEVRLYDENVMLNIIEEARSNLMLLKSIEKVALDGAPRLCLKKKALEETFKHLIADIERKIAKNDQ